MTKSSKKSAVKIARGAVYASVGLDVSDRKSCVVGLDEAGSVILREKVTTRSPEMEAWAMSIAPIGDRAGSGAALAVDQPASDQVWARGHRGQPGQDPFDFEEPSPERSSGRRVTE